MVKPSFLYGDVIPDDEFIVVAEECRWLWEVDGRGLFLLSMVRCYSISDFQYVSIVGIMGEPIFAYWDRVAFRIIDRHGGRSTEMGGQAMGIYPSKYGVDMLTGKELVKATVFASAMGGQYSSKDFRAEGWIYGLPLASIGELHPKEVCDHAVTLGTI